MSKADDGKHRARRGARYFVAATALCTAVAAHADDNDNIFQSVNTQLTVLAGGQHTNYRETGQGQSLDSEKGYQPSYQGKLSIQKDMLGMDDVYLSASFGFSKGRTNYDGYLISNSTGAAIPYQAGTRTDTTDITVKLGKAFPMLTPQAQVIYYVYYSYHQWIRDSTSLYGYDEHYRHNSVGVGMIGQYAFTPDLVGSVEGSVGGTFGASMNADILPGKFKLGSSATFTGALSLDYAITRHIHVDAAYQVTHFKYGQSGVIDGGYYEPQSTTTNQTVQLGMGYAF